MEQFCQVIIKVDYEEEKNKKKKITTGLITGLDENISFDPLLILADLRYSEKELEHDDLFFDAFDYEFEYAFGEHIKVDNRDQYATLVLAIKQIIKQSYDSQCSINLNQIELLKSFFDITFQFTPIIEVTNPLKHIKVNNDMLDKFLDKPLANILKEIQDEKLEKIHDMALDSKHESDLVSYLDAKLANLPNIKTKVPLHFSIDVPDKIEQALHYSHYSVENFLNYNLSKCHEYFYECYSLADVIFSVLHFLALNRYKFNKCLHCDRYYAASTYKYCSRHSLYPTFEHLPCDEAQKNIKQKISREHRKIYKNLFENYPPEVLEDFETKYSTELKSVKEHPNTTNIDSCFALVNPDRWYTKEYTRLRGEKLQE